MKQKRKFIYLTFMVCILKIFSSCETEKDFIDKQNQNKDLKVRNISFDEFKKNTNALNSLSTVQNFSTNNSFNRYIYDPSTNLIIDTETIKEITITSTYKSYTILVIDELEPEKVKNLLLSEKYNNDYDVYLLKYNLTETDKLKLLNNESIFLEDKTEVFAKSRFMHDLSNPVRIDADGNCYVVDRIWQEGGAIFWNIIYVDCPYGMGGTSTGSNDGSSSSNAGVFWTPIGYPGGNNIGNGQNGVPSGSSGNSDPVITEPIVSNQNSTPPCNDLKAMSVKYEFRQNLATLKTQSSGQREKMKFIYNDSPEYSPEITGNADGSITLPPQTNQKITGYMHCHLEADIFDHLGVFTPEDMIIFDDIAGFSNQASVKLTIYLVCKEGTFALKINDPQKLLDFRNKMANDPAFNEKNFNYFSKKIKHNMPKDKQIKLFLEYMADNDVGVDLYEGNSTYTAWKKLSLDENNQVKRDDC